MKRKKRDYHERRVFGNQGHKGLGVNPLNRQRGLKGSTLGPANDGRKLTAEERAAIEAKMREDGQL